MSAGPSGAASPAAAGWLARLAPSAGWLRGYDPANLRLDIVAGITLADIDTYYEYNDKQSIGLV